MELATHNLEKNRQQSGPSLPLKTRITMAIMRAAVLISRRRDGTVRRCLFNCLTCQTAANPKPVNHVKTQDIVIDPSRNLYIRIYTPTLNAGKKLPVLVYYHGGGFVLFTAKGSMYDKHCRRIAREVETVVVSVNYRLSPENEVPAAYDDGFDVLKYLDDNIVLPENAMLSKCFISGDSAGGNLGHFVITRASKYKFRELKVVGFLPLQPFFGGEERTESEINFEKYNIFRLKETDWFWASFLPKESNRDNWASNVSGPNAMDISDIDYPPTIVIVGGFDLLKDWQVKYYNWLIKNGKQVQKVEYPNMFHVFFFFSELQETGELFQVMRNFIWEHVKI